MGKTTIDDCRFTDCPRDPAALGADVRERRCSTCDRNVYDCSSSPGDNDWRRIEPLNDGSKMYRFSTGDTVRITAGSWEGFEAGIFEINDQDQAALIMVHIFSRHVPFWISLRSLRRVEETPEAVDRKVT